MLNLAWWWALALLPLPLLLRRLPVGQHSEEFALAVPLLQSGLTRQDLTRGSTRRWSALCLWLFWICVVLAASRPYWLGDPVSRTISGRDLMLAVHISGSMSEMDMTINSVEASRIDVLKVVVEEFIARRDGDRVGLILFGTNAYTFVPLTFDLDTLKTLLLDVSTGLAGRRTAIGDAIGLAVKSMREQQAEHKVLVLVTDGSNTAGFDDPVISAIAARRQGMTIYTIGVGSDRETLSRAYGNLSIPPGTILNETVLRQIATVTGGQYFRATDTASLERIYAALDELEPVEHEFQFYQPRDELFALPLSAGLVVMLIYLLASLRIPRAIPE